MSDPTVVAAAQDVTPTTSISRKNDPQGVITARMIDVRMQGPTWLTEVKEGADGTIYCLWTGCQIPYR